ncbi:MAG: carboxymuconolactone decarboxylase family protein [Alphaproteobacteria bacterium]|nr:carboxymuconolactone decarboxylase family protein [Alphaproteobacteria bacterium]
MTQPATHPVYNTIDTLKEALPDFAKDIRLNLSAVLKTDPNSGLSQEQVHGIALSAAYATQHPAIITALEGETAGTLSDAEKNAAKAAATVMAMNNVYYRFIHLAKDQELAQMPAGLRMNVIGNPGIEKATFELYSLGVSAINGCGMCIESHTAAVQRESISKAGVQHCVRIAAVITAAAQALAIN